MINMLSTPTSITIALPSDLIDELKDLANEQNTTIDEIVREACLDWVEPYFWERVYKESKTRMATSDNGAKVPHDQTASEEKRSA